MEQRRYRRRGHIDRAISIFSRSLKYLFLSLFAFISLFPFLWLMGIAFRPESETYTSPVLLVPRTLTLDNFPLVFERLPEMLVYFRNSFIITGLSVSLVVLVSALGGYALSRLRFRGKTIIFLLVVASMYMPRTIAMPSLYQLLFRLNLIDTYRGLILPYVAWHAAITTVLMRSVFQSVSEA